MVASKMALAKVVLSVIPVVILLTGCGASGSETVAGPGAGESKSQPAEVQIRLNEGVEQVLYYDSDKFNSVVLLVPDPAGGVWAWSASADSSVLQHYDAVEHHARTVDLGNDDAVRLSTGVPSLAICEDKTVWFTMNHVLVHVAADGAPTRVSIPDTTPIPAVDEHRPADLRGVSAALGVSCTSDGVAIALTNSTTALRYRSATNEFSSIDLPQQMEATSIASSAGDALLIGLTGYSSGETTASGPHQALLIDQTGVSRLVPVVDSTHVVNAGSGFRMGSEWMSSSGQLADDPTSTPRTTLTVEGAVYEQNARGTQVSFGEIPCISAHGMAEADGGETSSPSPRDGMCSVSPTAVTVDGSGTIYAALPDGSIVAVAAPH